MRDAHMSAPLTRTHPCNCEDLFSYQYVTPRPLTQTSSRYSWRNLDWHLELSDRSHPQIAPSQTCLTHRFFRDELPEKKMHLDMSSLSFLLNLDVTYIKSDLHNAFSRIFFASQFVLPRAPRMSFLHAPSTLKHLWCQLFRFLWIHYMFFEFIVHCRVQMHMFTLKRCLRVFWHVETPLMIVFSPQRFNKKLVLDLGSKFFE